MTHAIICSVSLSLIHTGNNHLARQTMGANNHLYRTMCFLTDVMDGSKKALALVLWRKKITQPFVSNTLGTPNNNAH